MRWHPWTIAAGASLLAGVGYLVVDGDVARETVWRLTLIGSCVAIVAGVQRNRPARRLPWWLLLAALGLISVANLLTYPLWAVPGAQVFADLLSMVAFPLIGVASLAIFRAQAPGGDRESAIDGFIVMIAMAAILASTVFHPDRFDHGGSTTSLVLNSLVAPLMMAAVTAAAFRLLFIGSLRILSVWLLVLASAAGLFGNTMRAWLGTLGVYERGVWSDVFILLSYASVGLAALHPSSPQLTERADQHRERFTVARVAVLGIALIAAPATLLLRGGTPMTPVLASILLSVLVLARLSHLVADRERSRRELQRQAVHDALTGLPNRLLLVDRLGRLLSSCRRRGCTVAVLFVDLDDFKRVNDDHGHQVGDQLLVALADRLRALVRDEDTVGRMSGDEFVVVAAHDDRAAIQPFADRLLQGLSAPFHLGEHTVSVAASIGLVLAEPGVHDPEQLLGHADAAMYEAKRRPGGTLELYDERLDDERRHRRRVELELTEALAHDELSLVYQPLVRTDPSGLAEVVGVETLLRWDGREPPISPGTFIPIAERSDLIVTIGDHVVERACAILATWEPCLPDDRPFTMYVNLASRQLADPQLPRRVADVIERTGISPDHLGFEVSETAVLDERAIGVARELARLGVRLALDDFGTGFSSIAHLKRLPLQLIKLDGSLVRGAVTNAEDRAIVLAVVAVARELGIDVLAEQVETADQLEVVEELGCRLIQGFLAARPAVADEVALPFRRGNLSPQMVGEVLARDRGAASSAAR